jgi:acetyltransferase-like isoleucine patch superfamily enzyme
MTNISKTAIVDSSVKIGENVIIHDYVVIHGDVVIGDGVEIFEFSLIGKEPKAPGCSSRPISKEFKPIIIGADTIISPGCVIYKSVTIGHNCLIGDNTSIREENTIGNYVLIGRNVTINYHSSIGDYTKIMDGTHITGNAKVGCHVFISILVSTTNDNTMGRSDFSYDHVGGPIIDDFVTIGAAASILPNIHVGKNCIVGSGAVVTKDVEPNTVVMGVPAKPIRKVS